VDSSPRDAAEPPDADGELLARVQAGEPAAFDAFVERWGDRIYRFGLRVCGEREDARDVAQDTLIRAFQSLKDLREPRAVKSWLYRIVANACLMKRRRGKFEPRQELSLDELRPAGAEEAALEIPDVSNLPDDALEREELRRTVREAVALLPEHYRVVLVLRDMEQLSTREVCEALGLPETTVKMRLHRARLMVRRQLAAHPGTADA
jgi:RNA polymerase sigma-70 factor (ECF subfamily)